MVRFVPSPRRSANPISLLTNCPEMTVAAWREPGGTIPRVTEANGADPSARPLSTCRRSGSRCTDRTQKKYGANASARVSLAQPADPQYNADLAGRLAQLVEQLTLNQRVRGSSPRSPSRELCKGRAWLSGFCRRHFSGPLPRPAASRCAAARPKYVTRGHAGFSGEAEFLAATDRTIVSPNHQSSSSSTVRFFHYINKLQATPRLLSAAFRSPGRNMPPRPMH